MECPCPTSLSQDAALKYAPLGLGISDRGQRQHGHEQCTQGHLIMRRSGPHSV